MCDSRSERRGGIRRGARPTCRDLPQTPLPDLLTRCCQPFAVSRKAPGPGKEHRPGRRTHLHGCGGGETVKVRTLGVLAAIGLGVLVAPAAGPATAAVNPCVVSFTAPAGDAYPTS